MGAASCTVKAAPLARTSLTPEVNVMCPGASSYSRQKLLLLGVLDPVINPWPFGAKEAGTL